jgi:hypothetical protein
MIQMAGGLPPVCLHVPSARLTLNQVMVYQFMLDQFFLLAPNRGKVLLSVRIAEIKRIPWKVNDQVASRFCNQRQLNTIVAPAKFSPFSM